MAVRIPTYERHVQLDAAAQTIPRYQAADAQFKALGKAGEALTALGLHWQKKEDAFNAFRQHNLQMQIQQQLQQIIQEERVKIDPLNDPPGTLHDRVVARASPVISSLITNAPTKELRDRATVIAGTMTNHVSTGAAMAESTDTQNFYRRYMDKISGTINQNAISNPDNHQQHLQELRAWLDKTTLPPEEKARMLRGYESGLGEATAKGYAAQGRMDEAQAFKQQWARDRQADDLARSGVSTTPNPSAPAGTGTAPPAAPMPRTPQGQKSSLNTQRIAETNARPESGLAIEQAAAKYGLDPNQLKVTASIESGGDPKQTTGDHHGLFQLTPVEFGMYGRKGGSITDPNDNAEAFAKMMAQRIPELTQKLGHPPSPTELYLSHQQGTGGLVSHLGNPNAPAWQNMLATKEGRDKVASIGQDRAEQWAKDAIWGNLPKDIRQKFGSVENVKSADLYNFYDSRVTGGRVNWAGTPPGIGPDQRQVADVRTDPVTGETYSKIGPVSADVQGNLQPPTALSEGGRQLVHANGQQVNYVAEPGATYGRYATANAKPFNAIVTHYTGSDNLQSALSTLKGDPGRGGASFGYHFYIDKDGTVYQGAPLDARTNHVKGPFSPMHVAGARTDITNENAIGISFVGSGEHPTEAQIEAGKRLAGQLQSEYKIPAENVVGHGELQTDRQSDEGRTLAMAVRNGDQIRALDEGPYKVAQAGGPLPGNTTGITTQPKGYWDQWADKVGTSIDAASMKRQDLHSSMVKKLKSVLSSDIDSTRASGTDVVLSKDLRDYFHTDKLSREFISNNVGLGDAITWQENKEEAYKVWAATANMSVSPTSVINQRLLALTPQDGAPDYDMQVKVYNAALKQAQAIDKLRKSDPAAAADAMPDVKAALDKVKANPNDLDAANALVIERMKAQQYLGIPSPLQTPLTKDDAKIIGAPLYNRTLQTPQDQATQVVDSLRKALGNNPDWSARALETILRMKGINDVQARVTTQALIDAQLPPPAPLVPKPPQKGFFERAQEGFEWMQGRGEGTSRLPDVNKGLLGLTGEEGGLEEGPTPESAIIGRGFEPNKRLVPSAHIQALRNNPEGLRDMFENGDPTTGFAGYGKGAADYFLKGAGQQVAAPPGAVTGTQTVEPDQTTYPSDDMFNEPTFPDEEKDKLDEGATP